MLTRIMMIMMMMMTTMLPTSRMHTYVHGTFYLPPHCVHQNILRQRRAGQLTSAVFSGKSIETTSKPSEKTCRKKRGLHMHWHLLATNVQVLTAHE